MIRLTLADGIIIGTGTVSGMHSPDHDACCTVFAYGCTVLIGAQGTSNHRKTDCALELAQQWKLPVVLFAEGGGGRPGNTEERSVSGLDCPTFIRSARLSGLVSTIGIASGRCFAGNAVLLGCADVIIATCDATIGMGGSAMIEGGDLGVCAPEEAGSVNVQAPNSVIDMPVENETEAVGATRRYLSYFQGPLADWEAGDVRHLRYVTPENRIRSHDTRAIIDALADTDSVLELRQALGMGIITALIRIEGRASGCIANNPRHLGGAIDSVAANKISRFMQLCNTFDLSIISLCDTPSFTVGPEAEKTVTARHVNRMFVTASNLRVPFFTTVLRKGYGPGAMAMVAGGFHAPPFTALWSSGEFGGMGTEGAIRLGYRKELEVMEDPAERETLFRKVVDAVYGEGRALNIASYLEIDTVIDPADTRRWPLCRL